MEYSQCSQVPLYWKSSLLIPNFLPHLSCLSDPGTHVDLQSAAQKTLKECPGKWSFASYMCLMQQLDCARNNDRKLLTHRTARTAGCNNFNPEPGFGLWIWRPVSLCCGVQFSGQRRLQAEVKGRQRSLRWWGYQTRTAFRGTAGPLRD